MEASLHNEKRQNTEEGEERKGGGGERDRNGNFSNKNVITKANGSLIVGFNYYFFFFYIHSPSTPRRNWNFNLDFYGIFFFERALFLVIIQTNKRLKQLRSILIIDILARSKFGEALGSRYIETISNN